MNCKEGDLAIVVKSHCNSEGLIVTCLRRATGGELDAAGFYYTEAWVTDRFGPVVGGGVSNYWTDASLRPIRNDPGADETLSWCDVPSEATVA